MPIPIDEFPIHQAPVSLRHAFTSDRNAYDRCYFNIGNRTDELFMVMGLGVYPNLGVIDGFASARVGDRQISVRASNALGDDRMEQRVGPISIDVIEPLSTIRFSCDGPAEGPRFDLTWRGSYPVVEEQRHVLRMGPKVLLDACRFAQLGTWEGSLAVGEREWAVTPDQWVGSRDRSWGIRPVGEAEPPGRTAAETPEDFGFYWVYAPVRFDDFAVVIICQEDSHGHRSLNEAVRVWSPESGRGVELLGWPKVEIRYQPGSRFPVGATITTSGHHSDGVVLDIEPLTYNALGLGSGYGSDQTWNHGLWKGNDWVDVLDVDLTAQSSVDFLPFSMLDHHARVTCREGGHADAVGYGLFEHQIIGSHQPSGFDGFFSVAD